MKIAILVVAYNAETTIKNVISRIPRELYSQNIEIIISDDCSTDSTYEVSKKLIHELNLPIKVIRQPRNLGYGGNQKFGYQWAIDNRFDLVVLLHGDGQYAPEFLPSIIEPIISGSADVVFGSRMLTKGGALRGGMPIYKFIGNKILTILQNQLANQSLSEWHSGYRAYKISVLKKVALFELSNGFRFDTQIILEMLKINASIREVPIPTFYGDEVSRVNGLLYAAEILYDTVHFYFSRR